MKISMLCFLQPVQTVKANLLSKEAWVERAWKHKPKKVDVRRHLKALWSSSLNMSQNHRPEASHRAELPEQRDVKQIHQRPGSTRKCRRQSPGFVAKSG
jgi:hypothetical protein